MSAKAILFLILFAVAAAGALGWPLVGVAAYILHYHVSPETQWWGQSLAEIGFRGSLILAVATCIGTAVAWRSLRFGSRILFGQEWLILAFLGLVVLSVLMHPQDTSLVGDADSPPVKLAKIVVFVMLLTHVVTNVKSLDVILWAIVAGVAYLGVDAYCGGTSGFTNGRLDNIGGPDFRESNGLAAYLVASMPIIAIQFLRSGWKGKLLCAISGALTANTIIMTRSRGAFIGMMVLGALALVLSPKRSRKAVIAGIIVAVLGVAILTDPGFWQRAETISSEDGLRDVSAQSRLEIWQASLAMLDKHPFGVGAGNFLTAIGQYTDEHANRDAHNTLVLCYSELGIHGLIAFLLLVGNAIASLLSTYRQSAKRPMADKQKLGLICYGLVLALVSYLACCMTISRLYTEATWWFLALPVCARRALENAPAEAMAKVASARKPATKARVSAATIKKHRKVAHAQ